MAEYDSSPQDLYLILCVLQSYRLTNMVELYCLVIQNSILYNLVLSPI